MNFFNRPFDLNRDGKLNPAERALRNEFFRRILEEDEKDDDDDNDDEDGTEPG